MKLWNQDLAWALPDDFNDDVMVESGRIGAVVTVPVIRIVVAKLRPPSKEYCIHKATEVGFLTRPGGDR